MSEKIGRRDAMKIMVAVAGSVGTLFLPGCGPTEGQPAPAQPTKQPTLDPNGSGSQAEQSTLSAPDIAGTAENWINGVPTALQELINNGMIDRDVLPGLKVEKVEYATLPGKIGSPVVFVTGENPQGGYAYLRGTLSDGSVVPMAAKIERNNEGKLVANAQMVAVNADVKGEFSLNEIGRGARVLRFTVAEGPGSVTVIPSDGSQNVIYNSTPEPGNPESTFDLKDFWKDTGVRQVVNKDGVIVAIAGKDVLEVKKGDGFEQHTDVSGTRFEVVDGPEGGNTVMLMGADQTITARINTDTNEVKKDTPRLWAKEGEDVKFFAKDRKWRNLDGIKFEQIKLWGGHYATGFVEVTNVGDGSLKAMPVAVADLNTGGFCRGDIGRQENAENLFAHAGFKVGDGPNDWKVWNQDTKEWDDPSEIQIRVLNLGLDPLRNYSEETIDGKEILRDNTLWGWPVAEEVDGEWRLAQRGYDFNSEDYQPRGRFVLDNDYLSTVYRGNDASSKTKMTLKERRGMPSGFERSMFYDPDYGWGTVGVLKMRFSYNQFSSDVSVVLMTNPMKTDDYMFAVDRNEMYVATVDDATVHGNTDYELLNKLNPNNALTMKIVASSEIDSTEIDADNDFDFNWLYDDRLFQVFKDSNQVLLSEGNKDTVEWVLAVGMSVDRA